MKWNGIFIFAFLTAVSITAVNGVAVLPIENAPSRLDEIACTICICSADYVHSNPDQSVVEVYAAMILTCKQYAQYFSTCQNTLDKYLPNIYQQAHNPVLSSTSICFNLQLCHFQKPFFKDVCH